MSIEDIRDSIKGFFLGVVIATTACFMIFASIKSAPHHHLEALFQIPLGLKPHWMEVFYCLWVYYWFVLWKRLPKYMPDDETAPKMIRISCAALFAILASWAYLAHEYPHLWHSSATKALGRNINALFGFSFPVVSLGAILIIAIDLMGIASSDPLERELSFKINWKRWVNHPKFSKLAAKKGLTYLGYEVSTKKPVFLSPGERNEHVHVVGTTGSGKTRYVLFPMLKQDIEAGKGVIFIDAKASDGNARAVQQMVTKAGREEDFLFFSLTHLDRSNTYNPLQHGDASQLKDKIMAIIEWSEPYYKGLCRHVLQSLFMELDNKKKRIAIQELYRLIQDKPESLQTFRDLSGQDAKDITNLRNEIGSLVNTHFGKLLSQHEGEINLLDAYRNQKIVYFALDTQSYPDTAASLGRIITQDIKTISGIITSKFQRTDLRSMAVYIDEFQAFGTRSFAGALSQCREAGFGITIAHQSLGDLAIIDPAYAQQVNDNTNTKIFLRVNDPDTAQIFSNLVGTYKKLETTRHVTLKGKEPESLMGSQKIAHEYLIHPSEVKNLDKGHAVFKSGRWSGRLILPGYFEPVDGVELPALRVPEKTRHRTHRPNPSARRYRETHRRYLAPIRKL